MPQITMGSDGRHILYHGGTPGQAHCWYRAEAGDV